MSIFNGATLNGLHTFKDFGLIKIGQFNWGSPEPKRQTVDIPGRDGVLDFSEAATGEIKYSNREVELNFAIRVGPEKVGEVKADIMNHFHGARVEAIDDEEPDWIYRGVASVSFPSYNGWKLYATITMDAEPYKLARDYTIVTADPSTFAAETIFLGQGNAAQGRNTIFTFGTKDAPQLDLTAFSTLTILWEDEAPYGEPLLQIADGAGNVYNDYTWINALIDGRPATVIDVDDITSINKSLVYRILCQNRSMGRLEGLTTASATVTAYVERMTVVPVWSSTADVTAFINGRKFEIPEGAFYNYEIQLKQGENQISFISDSADETIQLQYRDGRL